MRVIITAVKVLCGVPQSGKLLIDNQLTTVNCRIAWDFCLGSVLYVSWVHIQSSVPYALNSSQLEIPNSDDTWRKKLRECKINIYMQNSSRKVKLLLSSFPFSFWRGKGFRVDTSELDMRKKGAERCGQNEDWSGWWVWIQEMCKTAELLRTTTCASVCMFRHS